MSAGANVYRSAALPGVTSVYFVLAESVGLVKIGVASNPSSRFASLVGMSPVPLVMVGAVEGGVQVERWCHLQCRPDHAHHEWFAWTTRTKAFVELVLEHPDQARALCPREWNNDLRIQKRLRPLGSTLGPLPHIDGGTQATQIGAHECDACMLFASLDRVRNERARAVTTTGGDW